MLVFINVFRSEIHRKYVFVKAKIKTLLALLVAKKDESEHIRKKEKKKNKILRCCFFFSLWCNSMSHQGYYTSLLKHPFNTDSYLTIEEKKMFVECSKSCARESFQVSHLLLEMKERLHVHTNIYVEKYKRKVGPSK